MRGVDVSPGSGRLKVNKAAARSPETQPVVNRNESADISARSSTTTSFQLYTGMAPRFCKRLTISPSPGKLELVGTI